MNVKIHRVVVEPSSGQQTSYEGRYIHLFGTQAKLESYRYGEDYEEPFVGIVAKGSPVLYNKEHLNLNVYSTPTAKVLYNEVGSLTINGEY